MLHIGQLCVSGDWACVHGDMIALRTITLRLAIGAPAALHRRLTALAEVCLSEPEAAINRWPSIRDAARGA
jgi:hypothetical protein